VAISTVWARMVESEFERKLWLSRYIKESGMPAIVQKTGLIREPGDTITINKLNLLTSDGALGTTHTLSGQEEQLSPSVVSLSPSRYGNAVKVLRLLGAILVEQSGELKETFFSIWKMATLSQALAAHSEGAETYSARHPARDDEIVQARGKPRDNLMLAPCDAEKGPI